MLQASEKSNARILVIDDDPLFRNLMVSFLRREYFVSVASDGSEGFYKALEYPPDIAIVDVQMPVWDGLQTLKAFRSHPTLCKTKIIMLTSDASKGTVVAAIQFRVSALHSRTPMFFVFCNCPFNWANSLSNSAGELKSLRHENKRLREQNASLPKLQKSVCMRFLSGMDCELPSCI